MVRCPVFGSMVKHRDLSPVCGAIFEETGFIDEGTGYKGSTREVTWKG